MDDWIVYYEPVKVLNTRGYFATAKVQKIIPDPATAHMFIALMEPGSYLDFANPVPFKGVDGVIERGVLNEQGRISGRAQAAVRAISASDFNRIVEMGLDDVDPVLPRVSNDVLPFSFQEEFQPFEYDERERNQFITSRIVRDRVFRRVIVRAYEQRCAVTGLKLINGGGRAEVEAAHIRPVEANGPDIISNGLALSGTVHWMFDRGLISLTDDLKILISRHVNDPDSVRSLINKTGHALVPKQKHEQPHPHFLKWHRENCFKQ